MKIFRKLLFLVLLASRALAHEEGAGPGIGKGKGVEFYDSHSGFTLSKEALERFKIETLPLQSGMACSLTGVQIVTSLDTKKIFVLRDSKFLAIPAQCQWVKEKDRGVSKNAAFLRVIEMDLISEEEGHDE